MLNSVILCGRVGQEVELKSTPTGKFVTTFSIAVDRDFSANGEKETDWVNVVAWDKTAEFIKKYFSKGKMMIVNGRLQVRSYTDQNGKKCYVTEVVANNVYFAGDKGEKTSGENRNAVAQAENNASADSGTPADSFYGNPDWFAEEQQLPF